MDTSDFLFIWDVEIQAVLKVRAGKVHGPIKYIGVLGKRVLIHTYGFGFNKAGDFSINT